MGHCRGRVLTPDAERQRTLERPPGVTGVPLQRDGCANIASRYG